MEGYTRRSEPGYETLGLSLQAAVTESFKLNDEVELEIEHTARLFSRRIQEDRLHEDKIERQPGLKTEVAEALCSGDDERIADVLGIARIRAIAAVVTGVARRSVQEAIRQDINKSDKKASQSSTIEQEIVQKGTFANL